MWFSWGYWSHNQYFLKHVEWSDSVAITISIYFHFFSIKFSNLYAVIYSAVSLQCDPISLFLSVYSYALPAVESFAFSARATSLIGYFVSFPKQVVDTLDLIFSSPNLSLSLFIGVVGKVGSATFKLRQNL